MYDAIVLNRVITSQSTRQGLSQDILPSPQPLLYGIAGGRCAISSSNRLSVRSPANSVSV
jgi:hypothetical protein